MSKLTITGHWTWRDGEIQLAEFTRLNLQQKKKHLEFLSELPTDELSTNDIFIMEIYIKDKQGLRKTVKNFFSLNEEEKNN